MKNLILVLAVLLVVSCKTETKEVKNAEEGKIVKTITNADLENAVIYEANIRQYSPEGTFNKFTEDIPQLKELGVKIIWLMPIYPISTTKSKGTLGSYYAN